jgi:hypothetical protein
LVAANEGGMQAESVRKMMLRRILGPKRYKVTGEWRRLCRWEDNMNMDIQEVGWEGGGAWTRLIWLRLQKGGRLL